MKFAKEILLILNLHDLPQTILYFSLVKKKARLKQLFTCDDWVDCKYSTSKVDQKVEMIVLDHRFWDQAQKVCELFKPLDKLFCVVDTEVYPTM